MGPSPDNVGGAIRRNVEAIARMEVDFNRQRSFTHRVVDHLGDFAGSIPFVGLHVAIYGSWILVNLRVFRMLPYFDPFPFTLLSVTVGLEAIFLSAFVLMKQKRMSQRADDRAHLDLQVNLLAEREMTLLLEMVQGISQKLGVRTSQKDLGDLLTETSVEAMATELQKAMDPEGGPTQESPLIIP